MDAPDRPFQPKNLEEARQFKQELADKVVEIQSQLTSRDRTHPDGRRFTNQEYCQWRQWKAKATYALAQTLKQLRAVKGWIRTYHQDRNDTKEKRDARRAERRDEFLDFLLRELELGLDFFMEYQKKGLPDVDCKLAALDDLRRRLEGFHEQEGGVNTEMEKISRNK